MVTVMFNVGILLFTCFFLCVAAGAATAAAVGIARSDFRFSKHPSIERTIYHCAL